MRAWEKVARGCCCASLLSPPQPSHRRVPHTHLQRPVPHVAHGGPHAAAAVLHVEAAQLAQRRRPRLLAQQAVAATKQLCN
eukprot:365597-Chlamydomonas_euryale.AAC.5